MAEKRKRIEEEAVSRFYDAAEKTYHAKVTGRHAVTLPADLCRELAIEPRDYVEFRLRYGRVTMRRASSQEPINPVGMLAGYFESMDDINRFIAQERGRWTEEDEAEHQRNRQRSMNQGEERSNGC